MLFLQSLYVPFSFKEFFIHLLDMYFSKLPPEACEKDVQLVTSVDPWFTFMPVGSNTLNGMVKDICDKQWLHMQAQVYTI